MTATTAASGAAPAPLADSIVSTLRVMLVRELGAVRRTVEAYPDDAAVWASRPGLPNAGGTLVLHIAGNLQHFVGATLGDTGYVRDRDAEFARRDVPRAALVRELDATIDAVGRTLAALPPHALDADYPLPLAGRTVRTSDFLLHLTVHLGYHLGQLDYHRRLVTGNPAGVGALAPQELPGRDAG